MNLALSELQRGDELRYVTQHFTDLQGLRMAPVFAAFLLLAVLEQTHAVTQQQALLLLLGLSLLVLAWVFYAGRWYRRRYGLVTPREEDRAYAQVPSPVLSILATEPAARRPAWTTKGWFLFCSAMLVLFLAPLFQHRSDARYNVTGLVALVVFLLPKALYSNGPSPLTRGRKLLAIGGMAAIALLHVYYLFGRLDALLYAESTSAVMLLACLYDHWLLDRLLIGPRAEEGRHAE
jgi:hypothetical protein